ncbi:dihydropteroate synthase [bacterium]|nr:dihydropteroate synthase [bacterium]
MKGIRVLKLDRKGLVEQMRRVGVSEGGIERMLGKGEFLQIFLPKAPYFLANIIKQKMLALGGENAVSWEAVKGGEGETDCLILGTRKQIEALIAYLKEQPFSSIKEVISEVEDTLRNIEREEWLLPLPRHPFSLGKKPKIMGILNVTPDSFYDGGRYNELERAIARAEEMAEEGADIIDIGGESTRPGSEPISVEEEMRRVLPVIKELVKRVDLPISIDTYKSEVARAAVEEGAEIVNDISAMRFDQRMIEVVREKRVAVVLMHMKGTPKDMQINPYYEDVVGEVYDFLRERVEWAMKNGIDRDYLIIDPGIGFGKRVIDNIELIRHLPEFKSLGLPILIGPSRKSFIGHILGGLKPEERLEGTASAVAISVMKGANVIRVHDVREMKRVIEVAYAIKEGLAD